MALKRDLRNLVRRAGFDIRRAGPFSTPDAKLVRALEFFEIDLVLDIGANTGQFASGIRGEGYKGRIVSFEPLSTAHERLRERARADSEWIVHGRCAIGAEDTSDKINVSRNSVSSSLLPMLETHKKAATDSGYIGTEEVPIYKLDTVAKPYLELALKPFVKIDTQGSEWHVLDGAVSSVQQFAGIMCELSLVELYDSQRLWFDIMRRLEALGFALWAINEGFTDPRTGRSLQVDGIFFREREWSATGHCHLG